jgi:tetratricopeptide (TPR) repeat protein
MKQPEPWRAKRGQSAAEQAYETAVTLQRQGRVQDAARLYRAVLQACPDHFGALHYLGVVVAQLGKFDEAIELMRQAIALDSNSAAVRNDFGIVLAASGKLDEAITQYERAIAIEPNYIEAYNNLGVALLTADRPEWAVKHFESALAIGPKSAELNNNLGNALSAMARQEHAAAQRAVAGKTHHTSADQNLRIARSATELIEAAIIRYKKALGSNPDYAEANHNLANALVALDRCQEAIGYFHTAIALKPNVADAHNDLGKALMALERHVEAIACFRRALDLKPDLAVASNNLGYALVATDRHAEAIKHYRRALTVRPDFAEAYANLGDALAALTRTEEAIKCYTRALSIKSDLAEAHGGLGYAWQTQGHLANSVQAFERAVALAPMRVEYYQGLARARRLSPSDPHFRTMEALARNMASFTEKQQMALHFALGVAYADSEEHELALRHLLIGNAIKRKHVSYDEAAELASFDQIKALFAPELIREKSGHGHPSNIPIFIVGMPRSGSTLVEQILATHSEVFGAGERADLSRVVEGACRSNGRKLPLSEMLQSITPTQLNDLGAHYVASIRSSAPTAKHIADKMPSNFKLAGLISLALPNARIIHTRRNPIDTCWSCFTHLFKSLVWSNDLGEIGRYYRAYSDLMEHWHKVLPQGTILDVQYEDVVADFEPQARRIIAYCGLEWDERCLAFHETKRPIRTASAVQVRQPIYHSSVGRGRAYESWLEPLLQALGPMN